MKRNYFYQHKNCFEFNNKETKTQKLLINSQTNLLDVIKRENISQNPKRNLFQYNLLEKIKSKLLQPAPSIEIAQDSKQNIIKKPQKDFKICKNKYQESLSMINIKQHIQSNYQIDLLQYLSNKKNENSNVSSEIIKQQRDSKPLEKNPRSMIKNYQTSISPTKVELQYTQGIVPSASSDERYSKQEIEKSVEFNQNTLRSLKRADSLIQQSVPLKRNQYLKHLNSIKLDQMSSFEAIDQPHKEAQFHHDETGIKFINQYKKISKIGKGAFGKIWLVENKQNQQFAMKIIKKPSLQQSTNLIVSKEIQILKETNHKNVIKLIDILNSEEKSKIYMILEFAQNGCLLGKKHFSFLRVNKLSDDQIFKYWCDLISGLDYLHSNQIVHRDIKPDNLLINDEDVLKVTDFGVSKIKAEILKGKNGTPAFFSPEMITEEEYESFPVDIWAAGITLYQMIFNCLPFNGNSLRQIEDNIINQEIVYHFDISDKLKQILKNTLNKNNKLRWTAKQLFDDLQLTRAPDRFELIQFPSSQSIQDTNQQTNSRNSILSLNNYGLNANTIRKSLFAQQQ